MDDAAMAKAHPVSAPLEDLVTGFGVIAAAEAAIGSLDGFTLALKASARSAGKSPAKPSGAGPRSSRSRPSTAACTRLDFDIPKAKRSPDAPLRAELKDRVRAVLFAPDPAEARRRLDALLADRARYKGLGRRDTLGALERSFELYMTHYRVPGLPADANITENVIKQLGKKLRLMEGFATMESAERFSRLLIGCYRFKRFTDSCRSDDNGKSPLELAGVDLTGVDWLPFLLQR